MQQILNNINNVNNIKKLEKINYYLIDLSKNFIIDCCKTILHNIKNTEDYETNIFELYGDKRNITNYYKRTIDSFKELYLLNNDLYLFKNDFFKIKEKQIVNKNKKGQNLILTDISVLRNYDDLLVNFEFKLQFNIGTHFYTEQVTISLSVGKFLNNKFMLDKVDVINFRDDYNKINIDEQVKILTDLSKKQKEFNESVKESHKILAQKHKNVFEQMGERTNKILKF